jgi:ABC-2 type transport system ATP-binding protein
MTTHRRRPALVMHNITVQRGSFHLSIENLSVRHGEITCLVGPNGCGKTTLLLTMLGLLPYKGQCLLGDEPYDGMQPKHRAQLGYVPDDPEMIFEELTAQEQWSVCADALYRVYPYSTREHFMKKAGHLAKSISFTPPVQLAREYSHGMRKKTQIISALMGDPEVVILDEVRNGLDPIAIRQVEQLLQDERDRGAAVMAATHDLWWAERFADYIYIMDKGTIAAQGTCKQLVKKSERSLEAAFFRIIGADI